jgi:hypothetical protein
LEESWKVDVTQGFTSVRDVGGRGVNVSLRNAINQGKVSRASPQLIAARCVNDHIIGVTTIGERVKNEIDGRLIKELKIKNDNDPYKYLYELKKDKWFLFVVKVIDDMANNWLPRNLILWAQCNVTAEQHKTSSIRRDEKDLLKKLNFEHYSEDIIIEKYH